MSSNVRKMMEVFCDHKPVGLIWIYQYRDEDHWTARQLMLSAQCEPWQREVMEKIFGKDGKHLRFQTEDEVEAVVREALRSTMTSNRKDITLLNLGKAWQYRISAVSATFPGGYSKVLDFGWALKD